MGQRTVKVLGSRIGTTTVDMGDPAHDPQEPPFADPPNLGDNRPTIAPSVIARLLELPHEWLNLARTIDDARNVLVDAFAREVWSALTAVSNVAQKGTFGSGCYVFAYDGHPSQAVELRNLLIGTSAAGTVQLIAVRAADLIGSNPPYRILATVRTTATMLSLFMPAKVRLEPEEKLAMIYLTGASVNFDLSGEYRVLKG